MDHLGRLSKSTPYRLAEASRLMREYCNQRLSALGVKPAQINALAVLCDQKLSMPSEVARRLGISRPSVTHLLERMERDGLIQRVKDRDNLRRIWIVATPKGMKVMAEAEKVLAGVEAELSEALSVDLGDCRVFLAQISSFVTGDLPSREDPEIKQQSVEVEAESRNVETDAGPRGVVSQAKPQTSVLEKAAAKAEQKKKQLPKMLAIGVPHKD